MEEMDHTLVNPNQCRHFGAEIQDNPYHADIPMTITSPNDEFVPCLQSEGTVVFLDTWFPSQLDLESYPHVKMTSRHHWNPHQIQFLQTKYGMQ